MCAAGLAVLIASASFGSGTRSAHAKFVAVPAAGNLTALTATNAQPFSGQVTETSCGSSDVSADPSSTIDIAITAQVPTNDIMVNLIYGGTVVHNEDTGVGQETFVYSVDSNSGGTYTLQVCKSGNPATPFLPAGGPYPYDGTYTDIDVSLPTAPIPPPGSTTNPTTVKPVASYANWNAKFAPATVVDPQRTEGEPIVTADGDGNLWESGPWGFSTAQSYMHRSTDDGRTFNLVSATGLRPDSPPGGGDTDQATDDQGNIYFADLEGLEQIGTSVSHDNGMNWSKNAVAVQQTAVDRQWYAVDNGPTASASDNTLFLSFHETGVGTFIYSSPGSTGPNDPVGGLVWQNSAGLPGPLQPIAGDAVCAKVRFDPVLRDVYYACDEGDHVRISVGHVNVGQRTGIVYKNYNGPATPGGGSVLSLFPTLATDSAGNVYIAWIDKTNSNVYYAFSTDQGQSWSDPVRVNNGQSVTNEFDWMQAGPTGRIAIAWYGTARSATGGSDGMPSALADEGLATAYPWYGYAALITAANTTAPKVQQAAFTEKPMHFGGICNSGLGCSTSLTADRQMADFFGFTTAADGSLRIVFDDTTNEFDGAGLFATRQISGTTLSGSNLDGKPATDPVSDPTGDAQYPHYSPAGVGPNLPQLDLTGLRITSPSPSILRVQLSVADLSQLLPPPGKTTPVWLVRFQALGPLASEPQNVYHVYYIEMQKTADAVPQFYAGTASCQTTTPTNCKLLQYRGEKAVDGSIKGNTITIDVGLSTGFGVPIVGKTLYNVTGFTFGRNDSFDDLYAGVDSTQPFDYVLGSLKK
ncbi:MAG TPA: hypothetical protein VLE97_03180 [Gaiellaceae bacterium]|nr:hypothetical protein [Gaiellaceae bacterium]